MVRCTGPGRPLTARVKAVRTCCGSAPMWWTFAAYLQTGPAMLTWSSSWNVSAPSVSCGLHPLMRTMGRPSHQALVSPVSAFV